MHAGSKINVHCMRAPYWGKLEQSPCVHHYFLKCVKFIIHFFLAMLFCTVLLAVCILLIKEKLI